MYSKTMLLPVLLITAALCSGATLEDIPGRPSRSRTLFFNLFRHAPQICTGCPQRYCDADPGIILGYCCGCRGAFDILPVYCSPDIFCPPSISDICHDYEYMLNCCC